MARPSSLVTLYPLGVSGSGAGGKNGFWDSNYVLRVDGRHYILDCPRGFHAMLADNARRGAVPVTLADYRDVILTHLHFDHAEGLVEIAHSGDVDPDQPINLYAPAPMLDHLWSQAEAYGVVSAAQVEGGAATLDRCFRRHPLDNPHDFGAFRLHYRPTRHIANTFAYIFDFGNYRLGFSADTAFDPDLIAWLDTCDVVIHEVIWGYWSTVESVRQLHAPLPDLLTLPPEFQRKTLLCHYDGPTAGEQVIGEYRFLQQQHLYTLMG
jgi:ribonuclease BN (tRNA processing enzyme)